MSATFDTLKFAETLKSAGMSEQEARALTQAFSVALQEGAGQLATRQDILALDSKIVRLEGKFDALEERTKGRFTLLARMLAFVLAMQAAILWMLMR